MEWIVSFLTIFFIKWIYVEKSSWFQWKYHIVYQKIYSLCVYFLNINVYRMDFVCTFWYLVILCFVCIKCLQQRTTMLCSHIMFWGGSPVSEGCWRYPNDLWWYIPTSPTNWSDTAVCSDSSPLALHPETSGGPQPPLHVSAEAGHTHIHTQKYCHAVQ